MLARVLEPEVMDSDDEAEAYDAMDHADVNRRLVDDLLRAGLSKCERPESDQPESGVLACDVLDLGCGTARIAIELCQRSERLRVMAVDLSESMLCRAALNVELAGLARRIVLDRVDAKSLPYETGRFAAVISNSLVHHLPEPAAALSEAVRVAAPGGLIFFRDLLRPPDDAAVKRLVHHYAGGEAEHQQRLLDNSLRAALSLEEIRALVAALGYDRLEVRTTSDRHWTWAARKRATTGRVAPGPRRLAGG